MRHHTVAISYYKIVIRRLKRRVQMIKAYTTTFSVGSHRGRQRDDVHASFSFPSTVEPRYPNPSSHRQSFK